MKNEKINLLGGYISLGGDVVLTQKESDRRKLVRSIVFERDQAIDFIRRLLDTCELNLDNMEPETRVLINLALEWLNKKE